MRLGRLIAAALAALLLPVGSSAASLTVPFDFSRGAIGLDVTIKGTRLYMILDTGVDPSAIDIGQAGALGLPVDRHGGGEASGQGDAAHSAVFPATITGLAIGGRSFAPMPALAVDMAGLSAQYRRTLDGVLGYSFLNHRIVLIDYASRRLGILDRPGGDAATVAQACRKQWSVPLQFLPDDTIPIIPGFRLGAASAPISLDTGSNGGISLYPSALELPGVKSALAAKGQAEFSGARGRGTAAAYALGVPVGFGPFTLPAGELVTLRQTPGSTHTRVANIGNRLFAALGLKMLLDYQSRRMTFYGDCGSTPAAK